MAYGYRLLTCGYRLLHVRTYGRELLARACEPRSLLEVPGDHRQLLLLLKRGRGYRPFTYGYRLFTYGCGPFAYGYRLRLLLELGRARRGGGERMSQACTLLVGIRNRVRIRVRVGVRVGVGVRVKVRVRVRVRG